MGSKEEGPPLPVDGEGVDVLEPPTPLRAVLLKSPSRIALYMTFAFVGSTAKPFTVRLVCRPPTSFHPQKQSGSRWRPSAVPA